jgi:secondary thiamine-phosphate synthase enzyme
MHTTQLTVDTSRQRLVDLTDSVTTFCQQLGDGLVNVFVPHSTAGLAVMELGSGSEPDLEAMLDRLLPRDAPYRHQHGARGHGADHLLPSVLSPSLTVPVLGGRPALGVWQSIVLVDLNQDNPSRHVRLSFIPG